MLLVYLREILKHSILYGLSNFSVILASLVLIPLYTRYLSVQEFGVFSLVNTYGTFLIYVLDFGLATAFVRRFYDDQEANSFGRKRLISTLLWFLFVTSSILTLAMYLVGSSLNQLILGSYPGIWLVQLMTMTVFLNTLSGVPLNVFRVHERPRAYVLVSTTKALGLLALVPILLVALRKGLVGIFEAYFLVALLVTILGFFLSIDHYGFLFSREEFFTLLKIGLPFWPTMFLSWVLDYSDMYLLKQFYDMDRVGIYSLGYRLGQIIYYAAIAFSISWAPILFKILEEKNSGEIVAKLFKYYALALVTLSFIFSIFSRELIGIVATSAYSEASFVVPFVCFSYMFYGLFFYFLSGMLIAKKLQFQSLALGIGAVLNVGLNLLLIPRYNIYGAATATLLSYGVVCFLGYMFSQRLYAFPYKIRDVVQICAIGLASYLFYYWLREFSGQELLSKGISILLYLILSLSTGSVSYKELRGAGLLLGRAKEALSP